jgi:hypothetical protein
MEKWVKEIKYVNEVAEKTNRPDLKARIWWTPMQAVLLRTQKTREDLGGDLTLLVILNKCEECGKVVGCSNFKPDEPCECAHPFVQTYMDSFQCPNPKCHMELWYGTGSIENSSNGVGLCPHCSINVEDF